MAIYYDDRFSLTGTSITRADLEALKKNTIKPSNPPLKEEEVLENKKLIKDFNKSLKVPFGIKFGNLVYNNRTKSKSPYGNSYYSIRTNSNGEIESYKVEPKEEINQDKNPLSVKGIKLEVNGDYYFFNIKDKDCEECSFIYTPVSRSKYPLFNHSRSISNTNQIISAIENYYYVKIKSYEESSRIFKYKPVKKQMFISNSFDETFNMVKNNNPSFSEEQVLNEAYKAKKKKYQITKLHFNWLCKEDNVVRDVVEVYDAETKKNLKFIFDDVEFIGINFEKLIKGLNAKTYIKPPSCGGFVKVIKHKSKNKINFDKVYILKNQIIIGRSKVIAQLVDQETNKTISVDNNKIVRYDNKNNFKKEAPVKKQKLKEDSIF